MNYVIAAYGITFLALAGYGVNLYMQRRALIAELEGTAPPAPDLRIAIGAIGLLLGCIVGFLLRPAAPLVGQLSLGVVLSRGSNLSGMDALLVATAQQSFNLVVAVALIGAAAGAVAGHFARNRRP